MLNLSYRLSNKDWSQNAVALLHADFDCSPEILAGMERVIDAFYVLVLTRRRPFLHL